jgi:hypothetical protein
VEDIYNKLVEATEEAWFCLLNRYTQVRNILKKLLLLYSILKAVFNNGTSYYIISLDNSISLLNSRVVTSPLVRQDYFSYKRIIC